jgi:hypothetical protein
MALLLFNSSHQKQLVRVSMITLAAEVQDKTSVSQITRKNCV